MGPGTSTITLTIPAGYAGGVAGVDGNYSRSAMIKIFEEINGEFVLPFGIESTCIITQNYVVQNTNPNNPSGGDGAINIGNDQGGIIEIINAIP